MTEMKENSNGLIPFSYKEVKVGDRIISQSGNTFKNVFYILRERSYVVKDIDYNRREILTTEMFVEEQDKTEYRQYFIDRRLRYKRILDSLLLLIR